MDKSLDFSENASDENTQNEEPGVQGERNVEDDEDDDILITNIMKRIIKSVNKYQGKYTQEKDK